MPIRVHELAKELKISTAALKKHLSDMGVELKSHMSPVEDEVVDRMRALFNQEVAAMKQRQRDRTLIHKKIVQADKEKEEQEKQAEVIREKAVEIPEEKKAEVQKFVEKEIKKVPPRRPQSADTVKQPYKIPISEEEIKIEVPVIPTEAEALEIKRKEAEKAKAPEEKNKHIQAKVKHLKAGAKRKKKFEPSELEEAEISRNIKRTLATTPRKRRYKKDEKDQGPDDSKLVISEFTSVSELAKIIKVPASEIIAKFFKMGLMVTINQRLDRESLEMICDEFGFDIEFQDEYGTDILEEKVYEMGEVEKLPRPPVVTVMGHVDHGKTAILDYIRSANVIAGEAGGITQHIGAYQAEISGRKITFIDTPGHEAFAAMRARGANITDIAVIVVSASEGVKKQTVEAIDHAKAAGVQIIVAINKIDLKDANLDRVIGEVMKQNLLLEGYGGEVLWAKCSAKTGEGITDLLDTILLAADMLELKVAVDIPGKGVVIEARKDQRMGTVVTILMQEGTLHKGDHVVCGATFGRIRKMEDERGNEITELHPSDVALLYGITDVPKAGDILNQADSDKMARQISTERSHIRKEREMYQTKINLDNLFQKIKENEMSEIKLIIKADTDGSVEALCDSFQKLSTDEILINIIRRGVGGINDADVNLAAATDAIIIGFHVRPNSTAKHLAEEEKVEIKLYQIIYEAIEDLKLAMTGMLAPEIIEKSMGSALVKQIFKIKNVGTIAGCYVEKGSITNSGKVRLYRNDMMIHQGDLASLKHYSEEVAEVKAGSDCGITIAGYNDIKEGDIIENFILEEVAKKL